MHHHDVGAPQVFQHMRQWFNPVMTENSDELVWRTRRIGQWPEEIEQGTHPHFTARADRMLHGAMMQGGKHESYPGLINTARYLRRCQIDINTCRLQHIGAAGFAGYRTVAVLGHLAARSRNYKGAGRGDVKCGRTIATRTAGVHLLSLYRYRP